MNSLDELNALTHFGVLGMKWGRRKGSSSGGSNKRKLSFKSNSDGRKVERLFGKRNRTKIRKAIFGDEKAILKSPIFKKKYSELSPEKKRNAEKTTRRVLTAIGLVSIASLAYMFR